MAITVAQREVTVQARTFVDSVLVETATVVVASISNVSVVTAGRQGPAGPQGIQGVQGPQGIQGDPGPAGATGSYTHDQAVPSALWTINHGLGLFPAAQIVDSAGSVVEGDIAFVDENTITITFNGAFAGKAYLNGGETVTKQYSQTIVGGMASEVITHNLGTRDVQVQLWEVGAPYELVQCDFRATTIDTITLLFVEVPAVGSLRIVVQR